MQGNILSTNKTDPRQKKCLMLISAIASNKNLNIKLLDVSLYSKLHKRPHWERISLEFKESRIVEEISSTRKKQWSKMKL